MELFSKRYDAYRVELVVHIGMKNAFIFRNQESLFPLKSKREFERSNAVSKVRSLLSKDPTDCLVSFAGSALVRNGYTDQALKLWVRMSDNGKILME